jgi:hypothetical protein
VLEECSARRSLDKESPGSFPVKHHVVGVHFRGEVSEIGCLFEDADDFAPDRSRWCGAGRYKAGLVKDCERNANDVKNIDFECVLNDMTKLLMTFLMSMTKLIITSENEAIRKDKVLDRINP